MARLKRLKKERLKNNLQDFSENDLPHNRKEVFFDVIKQHWRTILLLGVFILLFSLPIFGLSITIDFFKYSSLLSFNSGEIDEIAFNNSLYTLSVVFILVLPICMVILGVGLGGIIRIIKRLCYLEPIFVKDDFKKGIKQNGKFYVLVFLMFSLVNLVTVFLILNFKDYFACYIPVGLAVVMFYPCVLVMLYIVSIYDIKFFEALKLSYKVYWRTFLFTLPCFVLVIAPAFFFLIQDIVLKHLLLVTYCFVTPFSLIFFFLYISSRLDKLVNQTHFPELVDKGIVRLK